MATRDLNFTQYFSLGIDFSLLIIYSLYIYKLRTSLESNGQKINDYIKATLICLGISIVLVQFSILRQIIMQNVGDAVDSLISGFLNQAFEKLGIFIDILRLQLILVVALIQPIKKKQLYIVLFGLAVFLLVIYISLIAWFLLGKNSIIESLSDTYTYQDGPIIYQSIFNIIRLSYSYITNFWIIFCYLFIYINFRRVFKQTELLAETDAKYHNDAKVQKSIRYSLLIQFIATCQIYVLRIARDSFNYTNNDVKDEVLVYLNPAVFSISKLILFLGIFISLLKQIQNSGQSNHSESNNVVTDSKNSKLDQFPEADQGQYQKYISVEDYQNKKGRDTSASFNEKDQKMMMNFYKDTLVEHQQMVINDNTTYRSSIILSQIAETFKREEGHELLENSMNKNLTQSLNKSPVLLHHIYGSLRQTQAPLSPNIRNNQYLEYTSSQFNKE